MYVEDPSTGQSHAAQNFDSFQFPPTEAKLKSSQSRPTSSLRNFPLQLPEIEVMEGELFNPHLLGQVDEVDEPPEYPMQKPFDAVADRSQNESPSAALRRVTPLQDPRKVYKSHQTVNGPGDAQSLKENSRLEECRREVAEQRSAKASVPPYSTQNERRLIDEAFGNGKGSYSLASNKITKAASKSGGSGGDGQAWNGREKQGRNFSDERRNSLPWLLGSKKDSGVGSEMSAKQGSPEFDGKSAKMERRGSMSWRLRGKGDRKDDSSGVGVSERATFRKSGLGFLNIFKR